MLQEKIVYLKEFASDKINFNCMVIAASSFAYIYANDC